MKIRNVLTVALGFLLTLSLAMETSEAQRSRVVPNPGNGNRLGIQFEIVRLPGYQNSGPRVRVNPSPGQGGGIMGAKVTSVNRNSPAKRAGLELGDIIVKAGQQQIQNANSLNQAIAAAGQRMTFQVVNIRNGQIVPVPVQFGNGGGGGGGPITPPGQASYVYDVYIEPTEFRPLNIKWDVDGRNEFRFYFETWLDIGRGRQLSSQVIRWNANGIRTNNPKLLYDTRKKDITFKEVKSNIRFYVNVREESNDLFGGSSFRTIGQAKTGETEITTNGNQQYTKTVTLKSTSKDYELDVRVKIIRRLK